MDNYNSGLEEEYIWREPSIVYMDDIHPLVEEEAAQAIAVTAVSVGLAKVLTAALACACTASTNHAKYSQKDIIRDRTIRRVLDV